MNKAVIIGSGLAGLASSIRLAVKGYSTVVFEANGYPGGKVTVMQDKGYRFDAGPSLFTLPHLVDELFTLAGKNPKDYFNYHKVEVACNYFWGDGSCITAWGDKEKFAGELEEKLGVSASLILSYLQHAADVYEATHPLFLEKSLHKWGTYLSSSTIKATTQLYKLHLLSTLNQVNEKKLKHPKLVQLFNRFATYNGSSPYLTPGVMSIIPHLEHNIGTFYPHGGIHSITTSLYQLARDLGVDFHFEEKVNKIDVQSKQATGIWTEKGFYKADIIVSNMDIVPTYRQLLPELRAPEDILNQPRSSSALIFYWGIRQQFPQLDLHNIFFSSDYKEEFEHIFQKESVSDDPTVYVNISSKEEASDAPKGCENWFVMVNVPPNTGQDWDKLIATVRERVLKKLSASLGVELSSLIEYESILDPRSIESKTSSFQGALYGASSNNRMAAFLRHPNFTSKIKGLYFCGGSVHPGGGIPLCLLSARITCDLIA